VNAAQTRALPAQAPETYDIFVDECGTLGSDQDDDPFGIGYFIAERTDAASALAEAIQAAFPKPFRLGDRRRKVEDAERIVGLVPKDASFFAGAVAFPDPEHPGNGLGDIIAQRYPGLSAGLLEDPANNAARRDETGRLLFCYEAALRLPLTALLDVLSTPRRIEICLHVGLPRRPQQHPGERNAIAGELAKLGPSFDRYIVAGLVPRFQAHVEIVIDDGSHPLHGIAELCAGVGWHLMKETPDASGLVSATQGLFARGALRDRDELVRGVTVLQPSPRDVGL